MVRVASPTSGCAPEGLEDELDPTAYLRAAESAAGLLRDPAVADAWDQPSALPEFSVRGLSGHLAAQVFATRRVLGEDGVDDAPLDLLGYYAHSEWIGADVNDEINVRMRERGEDIAAEGAAALAAQVDAAVEDLRTTVPEVEAERVVRFSGRALRFDDFLITRMMEIAVHSDDLAVSVGVDTPALPPEVVDPVLSLLSRLAVRRHGQAAVLRALSRAERAPETIAAI
ncbi:hypothetical protein GCM10011581_32300 [Saccharopolyspora subtropica]|uniref:Mycothiol-dependent maleylpyruvate isomerase metal-binding domain-containing protein n=1 Tax=Saccharopolyspora thermophila TaxID=89367 RepID=A0A917JYD6_9PSEU|nr:maleylpyruvate isomerase N-terminal domain-containing protein [Saccharopolyspora subtropica]GGI92674.1 hypothetical protein GCM10011581_32300 [Saccharopolyspora subtropica]